MNGPQFFQTPMGRKFYERDVPNIAKQLERIAEALEARNERDQSYNMKFGDPITIGGEEEIKKFNVVYYGKNDRKFNMIMEARNQEEVEKMFSERYAKLDRHIAYIENWTDDDDDELEIPERHEFPMNEEEDVPRNPIQNHPYRLHFREYNGQSMVQPFVDVVEEFNAVDLKDAIAEGEKYIKYPATLNPFGTDLVAITLHEVIVYTTDQEMYPIGEIVKKYTDEDFIRG